jgi:C-terminal processing protease CtpA/Prc
VNEHTTCAAEMVALFAQERGLATIVGMPTPGRLVSHRGFKVGHGFTLVVPTGAYVSWIGTRLDGTGIVPTERVDWSYDQIVNHGKDVQLKGAHRLALDAVAVAASAS